MIRKFSLIFFIVSALFISSGRLYAMGAPPPHKQIPVRILIINGDPEVTLRIRGPYGIVDLDNGQVLMEGRNLSDLILSKNNIHSRGMKILAENRSRIYVNGREFRGGIDIIKDKDGKLLVVNHIDVEEYLYGVLYHEVSHLWPIEALKAQAIVSRTYALYQKIVSKNKDFDLFSNVYSQVYGGRRSETWRTTKAVNQTVGRVLTYDGKIFPTYYHATCGGHTSDVTTLWNIDVPALRGRPCDFCGMSPHYKWKKELTLSDVQDALEKGGYDIQIVSFNILQRDPANRILELEIKGKGSSIKLNGNKFRLLVGPNVLRSTNLEITVRGRYVTFSGKGWGHGIGMCQWGAYGMSLEGRKVEQILDYYYPGSEITRVE
ncbi:MAG: SpoIID/LytB domain-containing protein [Candidatus Omnitrophica bacterium]|nr:SpoIID/LytB domain-containing protein [Candidatus Omnitrophota bacterium]